MKFADIAVGGIFTMDGEKMRKTGPATYVSLENSILGEYTIQPIMEGKIKPVSTPTGATVVSAKFSTIKIDESFSINGQAFKKTGADTYVSTDGRWPGTLVMNPMAEQSIKVMSAPPVKTPKPKPAAKAKVKKGK